MPKVNNTVTIGTQKFSYRANDIYKDLGGVTGVVKSPVPDNTVYEDSITKANFAEGQVIRVKARGVVLGAGGVVTKSRDFTIVCAADKLKAALGALPSKKITVGSITWDLVGARVPQRRRFS